MASSSIHAADPTWAKLYRIGGVTALVGLLFYLSQFFIILIGEPYPTTTEGWLLLFQQSVPLGLFYLNALDMISMTLFCLTYLAIYIALRPVSKSWMTIAALLALLGTAVFLTPRTVTLGMIPLSEQYAAATSEVQRSNILLIGDTLGMLIQATPLTIGFLLIALATLIVSLVMLNSRIFNVWTAYAGMLAGVLIIALHISVVLLPVVRDPLLGIGVLFWMVWLVMVAIRLIRIGGVIPIGLE